MEHQLSITSHKNILAKHFAPQKWFTKLFTAKTDLNQQKENLSEFYDILKKIDLKKTKISFRGIENRDDLIILKKYHEEWFPI